MKLGRFANLIGVLRLPGFGIFSAGTAVSYLGTWIQRVGAGWLAWQLTESATWLGVLTIADLGPAIIIGTLAGTAADRFDRLRLLKVAQLLAFLLAGTLFALVLTGNINIWLLFVLTICMGAVSALDNPVRFALIADIVDREHLGAAVSVGSLTFNTARLVGPAIAALMIDGIGTAFTFGFNALTFLALLFTLSRITVVNRVAGIASRNSVWADFVEGLRYAAGHTSIAAMLILQTMCAFGARSTLELLPGVSDAFFSAGAHGFALLSSAIGFGAIAGGIWASAQGSGAQHIRAAMRSALLLAVAVLTFSLTGVLWLGIATLTLAGFMITGFGISSQTIITLAARPNMRGRMSSMLTLIYRVPLALGALAIGFASDWVGMRTPIFVGSLVVVLGVAWVFTWREAILRSFTRDEQS